MSILGNIFGAIFGSAQASSSEQAPAQQLNPSANPHLQAPGSGGGQQGGQAGQQQGVPSGSVNIPYAPRATLQQRVDVEAVLDKLAADRKAKLDWRHSIVDLMKLLELDSSLPARKELAKELHYTGATDGSAELNIWLHKAVMKKLAENGGKVPESLKH